MDGTAGEVDGKTAAYKAVETTTLGGYDSQCADVQYNTDGSAAAEQCTNTHTPETTSIGVEKHGTTPTTRTRSALTA